MVWRSSFRKKAAAGYGAVAFLIALVLVFAMVAFQALHGAVEVITRDTAEDVLEVARLQDAAERANVGSRAFLMTRSTVHFAELEDALADLHESLGHLDAMVEDREGKDLLKAVHRAVSEHRTALEPVLDRRRSSDDLDGIGRLYEDRVAPARQRLDQSIDALMAQQERKLKGAVDAYHETATRTMPTIGALLALCLLAIVLVAFFFTRLLSREYEVERVARQAREEILALVSHDLKNPVGAIIMGAKLIEMAGAAEVDPKTQVRAGVIRRAAERMSALINDLLDASSMEAGRFKVEAQPCAVGILVGEAVDAVTPLSAAKSQRVEVELDDPDTLVQADRARILQVFGNLLGNAVKFTPEGGRIAVAAAQHGAFVRFSVADSGPGIPKDQQARLFERFFRGARSAGGGTGLGLYSAKGIVEAHGGEVWIDAEVTAGTTVHFTVPRVEV